MLSGLEILQFVGGGKGEGGADADGSGSSASGEVEEGSVEWGSGSGRTTGIAAAVAAGGSVRRSGHGV